MTGVAAPRGLQFPVFPETELVPPCLGRGLETGSPPNIQYLQDFHSLGVNSRSCMFLQSKFSEPFLYQRGPVGEDFHQKSSTVEAFIILCWIFLP